LRQLSVLNINKYIDKCKSPYRERWRERERERDREIERERESIVYIHLYMNVFLITRKGQHLYSNT
jgi:hypothetical protein